MSIHVFGVRHHGPGCARSLSAALAALEPEIVLVEGPPDAQDVLPLVTHERMRPPVALLVYQPEAPRHAVFYPFTHFSPEWQALRYAQRRGIPARFMDLPQALRFADELKRAEAREPAEPEGARESNDPSMAPPEAPEPDGQDGPTAEGPSVREDPIGRLAEAAGYTDHELWWEHQIEQRRDATDLFDGILEAMAALRDAADPPEGVEARREAYMRQTIRAAQAEGFGLIAVVCGAWHAPVLVDPGPAQADARLLTGLRRVKVAATWIPWTNSRLSYRSGYGAGVNSPGWYEHLWTAPDRVAIRWVARAARLLRDEDLDASSSSVIEAARLAEALAALRDLPLPGLAELQEAVQAVLCGGDPAPLRLIRERLEIGEALGEVPEETPAVPLQRDLAAKQRRLRLKPSAEAKPLDLDLRNETDRDRSRLLHQLRLLGVEWGTLQPVRGKSGTFHEVWLLRWRPELDVALIEANLWGNTSETAAAASLGQAADTAPDLPYLAGLLDDAILAALPEAVDHLLVRVQEKAAISADVRHLMQALPRLARIARYGDVRETRGEQVTPVVDGLFERVIVGLPGACASLDDEAARAVVDGIGAVQDSVNLLDRADQQNEWQGLLRQLSAAEPIHGLVRGWCCRLLLEQRALDSRELERLARLALSPAAPAPQAAAWVEGMLRGSGLLLLQQDDLWSALDAWLTDLSPATFVEMLPLLRRAFSGFQAPERRAMGEKMKRGLGNRRLAAKSEGHADGGSLAGIDRRRADLVLPVLAQILGVTRDAD